MTSGPGVTRVVTDHIFFARKCFFMFFFMIFERKIFTGAFPGQRMFPPSRDPRISRMLILPSGFSSGLFYGAYDYEIIIGDDSYDDDIFEERDDKQNLRPKPDALPEIYTTLGQDYDDRVNLMRNFLFLFIWF